VYEANLAVTSPAAIVLLSPNYGYFSLFGPVRAASGLLWLDVAEDAGGNGYGSGAVLSRVLDGCTPFAPSNATRLGGRPWLAIVRRGNCYFTQKVDNAYAAGAAAVFIVDSDER
jgi:hypothetical protein